MRETRWDGFSFSELDALRRSLQSSLDSIEVLMEKATGIWKERPALGGNGAHPPADESKSQTLESERLRALECQVAEQQRALTMFAKLRDEWEGHLRTETDEAKRNRISRVVKAAQRATRIGAAAEITAAFPWRIALFIASRRRAQLVEAIDAAFDPVRLHFASLGTFVSLLDVSSSAVTATTLEQATRAAVSAAVGAGAIVVVVDGSPASALARGGGLDNGGAVVEAVLTFLAQQRSMMVARARVYVSGAAHPFAALTDPLKGHGFIVIEDAMTFGEVAACAARDATQFFARLAPPALPPALPPSPFVAPNATLRSQHFARTDSFFAVRSGAKGHMGVSRQKIGATLRALMREQPPSVPIVVVGEAGCGCCAAAAQWAEDWTSDNHNFAIVRASTRTLERPASQRALLRLLISRLYAELNQGGVDLPTSTVPPQLS